jgi:hypothetical protein
MVEVVIDSVRVSLTNQQRIVVLREVNAERYLPIWIGPYEAEAITIALQEIEVARPQTHDLLKSMMTTLNARLVRVEVVTLRDDVFFGSLVLEYNGQLVDIDTRPSDALALAVRAHVPILVSREVMDSAGIIPEEEVEGEDTSATREPGEGQSDEPPSEERLSVFEDFLQHLKSEDAPSNDEEDDQEDQDPDKGGPKKKK